MAGPLLTTPKAAAYLGVSRSTLLRWVELGIAPRPIIDTDKSERKFSVPALDEWLRTNGTHAVDTDPTPYAGISRPEVSP